MYDIEYFFVNFVSLLKKRENQIVQKKLSEQWSTN